MACQRQYSGNPILPDYHADPSVRQWDGRYWIYPSTDEPGSTSWQQMKRWLCYSSTDLIVWTNHGEIFSLDSISWADERAYAPDCVKHNGRYYFYFPAAYQIGVAVSDAPAGPFRDALGKPLIRKEECDVKVMDPFVFVDEGRPYLFFGGGKRAAVVELNDDMVSRKGEIQYLDLQGFAEGLWVHKHKGLYYFSYPTGIKHAGKSRQLLVYSTAKNLLGPFEYRGLLLDPGSRNSQPAIIQINEQWYIFYHVEGPSPYERRVCVEFLDHNSDGSITPVKMSSKGVYLK